jgi:hypothetical protein
MIYSSIALEDVVILEGIFAYLTPQGWVIPLWLSELHEYVVKRDQKEAGYDY